MEINTTSAILRDLGIISDDENLLKRAMKYIHKLATEKQNKISDYNLSKEDYLEKLNRAQTQIKEGMCIKITNTQQLDEWLENL
ncbi:MAG: hypothetical protein HDS95_04505 [Bacteroidales bacterium]|nr:hypothetical protein [Bacteroidales bacterium]MBD5386742.1 hypothetical protein [bacterium]